MQNHAERDKHAKLEFKHALTPQWERNFHGTNAIAINFHGKEQCDATNFECAGFMWEEIGKFKNVFWVTRLTCKRFA